jgi:N-acetyl-gamma-glutamylphosphate reductase
MAYTGLTRRPLFVPSVGNFRQGMLVQLPIHLDMLPSKPRAADLHDALAKHYGQHPDGWVSVHPATDNAKLDALLGLEAKGMKSVLMLPIGYRDEEGDWLVKQKKVRKPKTSFVTVIE